MRGWIIVAYYGGTAAEDVDDYKPSKVYTNRNVALREASRLQRERNKPPLRGRPWAMDLWEVELPATPGSQADQAAELS